MNGSGEVQPQAQFEMPSPQSPETPPQGGELQSDQALEKGAPDENRVGKQQPPALTSPPPVTPVITDNTQTSSASDPKTAAIPDSGLIAKDGDKIEKQWIDKAKSIIAQTKDDPFIQKIEMSKVKAEYIQKRYNKTIPLDGTVAK